MNKSKNQSKKESGGRTMSSAPKDAASSKVDWSKVTHVQPAALVSDKAAQFTGDENGNVFTKQPAAYRGILKGKIEGNKPAAPQPAKAAQVGIQPRICVEGHDYMLVAEHYAVVNESIAAELHKTSQRDDAQDAVLDQTVKLNKAETELERVKGQLDSVRADAKNFRRLLDQEREELANVMVENVLLEEKLEAAIAKAEGRAS